MKGQSALIPAPQFHKSFENIIIDILSNALSSIAPQQPKYVPPKVHIWNKIGHIIGSEINTAIHVAELAQIAGTNERTLLRLFQNRFGVSTKTYLNIMRLNEVRRDLKRTSSEGKNITDIANERGFWHMGQCAFDYKKIFGELPSETSKLI